MDRFPHLDKANSWPGLSTVDPFDLQVTFDPYVWGPDVELHLVRTRLDEGYRNVVGWKTKGERDSWYDSHSDRSVRLTSEFHILPGQEVKLPIAFEVLQEYNQIFIDFPPTRTADGSPSTHRFFYFVRDVEYRSPSATACIITLDEWTTHALDTSMPFIRLERGHAPMAAVDVDTYLSNPLNNASLLGVQDDTWGTPERLTAEAITMIDDPDVWAVLALSASIWIDPHAIGSDEWGVPYSRDLFVQGAPSIQTVAVEPESLMTLLANIEEIAPQMMAAIQSCFIIPKKWVDVTYTREAYNVTVHEIGATQRLQSLVTLTRASFGYPSEYAGIAKLYTSPYAILEVIDHTGTSQQIRIEDTNGSLQISVAAALTYPALGIDVAVLGIGSDSTSSLSWDTFASHTCVGRGMWLETVRHYQIPTYMVTADPRRQYAMQQYHAVAQAQDQNATAESLSYQAAQASYDMQLAGLARQTARLGESQANATAQLALSQGADDDILDLQVQKTFKDLTADQNFMLVSTAVQQNTVALAASQAAASNGISVQQATVSQGVAMANEKAVTAQTDTAIQNAKAAWAISPYNAGDAVGGAIRAAGSALVPGLGSSLSAGLLSDALAPPGEATSAPMTRGIMDKIGGAIGQVTGGMGTPLVSAFTGGMTNSEYGATIASADAQVASAQGSVQLAQLNLEGAQLTAQNVEASYTMASGNITVMTQASQDLANAKWSNASGLAQDTLQVSHDMQSDSLAQQQATQNTINAGDVALGQANAARTKTLADTNTAQRKRLQDASILRGYRAAQLGTPIAVTAPALSSATVTRPQLIAARVITQSPAAIAAAGDTFLKWGYRFAGREWRISTLTPMPVFSFWMGEVQMAAGNINTRTREVISGIFSAGVTIWKDPDKIGSTSIYENRI